MKRVWETASWREKMFQVAKVRSEAIRLRWRDPEFRRRITSKLRQAQTPARLEKMSRLRKGRHFSPKTEFTSQRMKTLWQDPAYRDKNRRAILAKLHLKPNGLEREMVDLIERNKLPFRYCGDGSFLIDGLNPDFIATDGSKRLIEVFGRPFHDPSYPKSFAKVGVLRTETGRRNFFKDRGWAMIVIWNEELKTMPWAVVSKIKQSYGYN